MSSLKSVLFYVRLFKSLLSLFFLHLKTLPAFIARLPRYLSSVQYFLSSPLPVKPYPILFDSDQAASSLGEYFWQDLFVASRIREYNPSSHADIGSRVDGFVAQLTHFTSVVLFDLRPLTNQIPNVTIIQSDINNIPPHFYNSFHSVSCLHTLEHIGLGRYGDPISLNDWTKAIRSLTQLLSHNGHLWVSVPVGTPCIVYNAHRIFSSHDIPSVCFELGLQLTSLSYVNTSAGVTVCDDIAAGFRYLDNCDYHIAIYHFVRV
jgi:hypothetical protein